MCCPSFLLAPRRACLAVCLVLTTAALAQTPESQKATTRLLDEKLIATAKGNEILANLTHLSDVIGPRLTGSAALKRANEWTADKMKAYGLENVRLEGYTIPEGWERGTAYARVVEPDNGRTLSMAALGWTPGTNGRITADVVVMKAATSKELDAYKGKLKGAVVLQGPPVTLRPVEDALKSRDGSPVSGATPDKKERPKSFEEAFAFQKELQEFLRKEGAAVLLRDAAKHFGLLYTGGGWRGSDRPSASNRLPSLSVAHNHYQMLYRLASRPAPARTRIEIEVNNKFIPGPVAVYNTVGEIRGSEKPDEFVVVGAHLDSWDLGQGTTDNGTGSTAVLEAARLIAKSGIKPRRTIRFVLFSGEEQGLHGSRAYAEKHKATLDKTSACIVHDTGTGKVVGIAAGAWPAARELLEKELTGLKALGVTDYTSKSGGGSDHATFARAGVPGFLLRQEVAEYRFTHHSQADTLDRAWEQALIQGSQVMAVMAVRIANLDDLLPREKAK